MARDEAEEMAREWCRVQAENSNCLVLPGTVKNLTALLRTYAEAAYRAGQEELEVENAADRLRLGMIAEGLKSRVASLEKEREERPLIGMSDADFKKVESKIRAEGKREGIEAAAEVADPVDDVLAAVIRGLKHE